jgi:hypothetical protein
MHCASILLSTFGRQARPANLSIPLDSFGELGTQTLVSTIDELVPNAVLRYRCACSRLVP